MKQLKNQSGVTMVALVVTIVLMIIIAGILIATFSGKSGLVDKAFDSKVYTELKQLQDKLKAYKVQGEAERIKNGDYSGQMSNNDLRDKNVITYKTVANEEYGSVTIGLVNLETLDINSTLGNNYDSEEYKEEDGYTSLKDFNDVFALNVKTDDLYYINDDKIWSLNGEVSDEDIMKPINDDEIIITATPDNSKGWTNGNVTVYIEFGSKLTERKYGLFDANQETDEDSVELTVKENNIVVKATAITEDGEEKQEEYIITNIDKGMPEVKIEPNGGKYLVADGETKKIEGIKITAKDNQNESGLKEVKYAWSTSNTQRPADEKFTIINSGDTISSEKVGEGSYYLWVRAIDNAENITEEISWEYKVTPPSAPTVALKENDANGNEYVSGTWTNQNVYHEITLPTDEGTVSKYQYSTDGETWNDINEEIKTTIPYSTTFPMEQANKPEWLGDLTSNGSYYFVEGENGSIVSNNKGVHSTTANSYIKIDLSQYSSDEILNLTVNAQISSQISDRGYATITESENAPSYSTSAGKFIYVYGTSTSVTTAKDYTTTLAGGKTYYLHFGYYKNASTNSGTDTFTINSIKLESETIGKEIDFYEYAKNANTITYKLQDEINKEIYVKAIYEEGIESGTAKYKVAIDRTAPVINTISSELTSETKTKITVSDIIEKASGLKGYYISTTEEAPTVESEWISLTENNFEVENVDAGTNYYVWVIDNAGNISEVKTIQTPQAHYFVDNTTYTETLQEALSKSNSGSTIELINDYTDASTATIDKNIILNTGDYTLTRTVTINVKGTTTNPVTLEVNGKITSSSNINTLTTSGTVILTGNGTIETTSTGSSYSAISNSGNLTQKGDLTISGYYRGVYNSSSSSVFTLNSGKIEATYNSSSAYGLYAYGTTNINGGEIKGYNAIYAYTGTTNITGGNIKGTYGIYVNSTSATVNIIGGTIEGSTYGIYGYTTANGKITIGDATTEVNENAPIVTGGEYGILMRTTTISYNFYNGIIKGTSAKPYTDTINPREGYMVYTYYDYDNSRKYCTVLTQIVENITIEHTPTEWTNNDVSVQVKYPIIDEATMQYSADGENWIDVENGYITTITENKTVYARMMDESGIVLQKGEHKISNIDKIAPVVTINPETTKYTIYNHESDSVNIEVTTTVTDEGGSGIKIRKYGWSESKETKPESWIDFNSGDKISKQNCIPGTYYLWFEVIDNAGNKSEVNQIRYIVELQEAVAKIGENYFYTIQDAFDAAGTTAANVEIIKDTDETSIVAEGQKIILELNGHTIRKFNFRTSSYY